AAKTGRREIREHGCAPRRVAVIISKPFLKGNAFYGFIQRVKVNVSQQWEDESSLWCPTPLPHVNSGVAPGLLNRSPENDARRASIQRIPETELRLVSKRANADIVIRNLKGGGRRPHQIGFLV